LTHTNKLITIYYILIMRHPAVNWVDIDLFWFDDVMHMNKNTLECELWKFIGGISWHSLDSNTKMVRLTL
jgi:hypothetical protein